MGYNEVSNSYSQVSTFGKLSRQKWSESRSVMSDSVKPHGLYSPWNSPGHNTGVGSLSLLQGIFPTQDWTQVSGIAGGFFTSWTTREALKREKVKGFLFYLIPWFWYFISVPLTSLSLYLYVTELWTLMYLTEYSKI